MRILSSVAVLLLAACNSTPAPRDVAAQPAADSVVTLPTVEARDFPGASTVMVVGWSEDAAAFGLRTFVRRDGSTATTHRIYLSTASVVEEGGVVQAKMPDGVLELAPRSIDERHCWGGRTCSPYTTYGALIQDARLRGLRDSLRVRFYTRTDNELDVSFSRAFLDKYLSTVDSVAATLRKRQLGAR